MHFGRNLAQHINLNYTMKSKQEASVVSVFVNNRLRSKDMIGLDWISF